MIILLEPIPCFCFVTIMLYIWKFIIAKNTIPYCAWSKSGRHKWSANFNLHAFFGWTVIEKFLLVWWTYTGIIIALCILLSHILLLFSSLVLNNEFIWIWLNINLIISRKCGSSLKSLILNLPNKKSGPCLEHW